MYETNNEVQANLCLTLKSLVEEWGHDRISILMPTTWQVLGSEPLGAKISVEFTATDSIAIRIDQGKMLNLEFSIAQLGLSHCN